MVFIVDTPAQSRCQLHWPINCNPSPLDDCNRLMRRSHQTTVSSFVWVGDVKILWLVLERAIFKLTQVEVYIWNHPGLSNIHLFDTRVSFEILCSNIWLWRVILIIIRFWIAHGVLVKDQVARRRLQGIKASYLIPRGGAPFLVFFIVIRTSISELSSDLFQSFAFFDDFCGIFLPNATRTFHRLAVFILHAALVSWPLSTIGRTIVAFMVWLHGFWVSHSRTDVWAFTNTFRRLCDQSQIVLQSLSTLLKKVITEMIFLFKMDFWNLRFLDKWVYSRLTFS